MMMGAVLAAAVSLATALPSAEPDVTRPVAGIVSPIWSDPAHRDAAHEVDQLVARLHLRAGMSLADIGAGSGYDTVRLAKVLGPHGRVFAEDVTPSYLQQLRSSVHAAGLSNVVVVAGTSGDPRLPPRSIDAAIMIHMYHEIDQPIALLANLVSAFRPGGRLGIEELDRPTPAHGTPPKLLTCELAATGYKLVKLKPLNSDIGYFAVFKAPATARPGAVSAARTCRS